LTSDNIQIKMPQHTLNQSLGNYQNLIKDEQNFTIFTDFGVAKVLIYSHNIIRININKELNNSDFSYSVAGQAIAINFEFIENKEFICIKTNELQLFISKYPVRFQFKTLDNEIINEDELSIGTSWLGEHVTTYKKLQEGEKFIGLGEKTGNLNRCGDGYTNWNTDAPAYGKYQDPLYCTFPFYIGIHHNTCYGIYLDNTSKTHFNFGASNDRFSFFTAEMGAMDYYFSYHKTVRGILQSYSYLTGFMPMPPLWSLGYQQCRWSYYPDSEVLNIARTFREKQIPADVIYLDINYMDNYKVFTWHPEHFPNPKKLNDELKALDFHTVVIIDPGIKVEENYETYETGLKGDYFVKYPDNQPFTAQVWPGWCHFPDFSNVETRKWWGESFKNLIDSGIEGFWNDMNEIATWGQKIPELIEFQYEGQKASYRQVKNIYGMLMARSTFEGTKKLLNGNRPFVLTRSAFSGVQRFSAVWTGDNASTDEHLMLGARLINSLGISGVPFVGCDIGGFIGEPSKALFTRWMTLGVFSPFFRSHAELHSKNHEPWCFGKESENIIRNYINLRYKLLPYIYSTFYEATQTGMSVVRSLSIDYTFDENIYKTEYQEEYLFGKSILIAPVESTKELKKIYLPIGEWYNFHNNTKSVGNQEIMLECPLDKLPIFIKESAIIPFQSLIQNTNEKPSECIEIHVFKGTKNNSFIYYEDDGKTYNYENGEYYKRNITYSPSSNNIVFSEVEGNFTSKFKSVNLILHNFDLLNCSVNDINIIISDCYVDFLNSGNKIKCKSILFPLINSEIEIKL